MDKDIIESIEASLWSLQENLDHTCNLLSTTLPKIHMDLQRTHSKASRTLDLIKTTDSPGKIGTITDKLRQVYQSALVHIEDLCEQDSLVLHHARRALALFHRKESDSLNSPGMQEAFALCDALSEQIKQIIPAEKAYITDMDALFQENISRLKDALNNITLIFRDLAQRCEATDLPIHNIMTSLQFHDIVDQDLQVINKGIQEIKQHQDTDEFFAFENRFNTLSMEIIKELLSTSRDRAEEIEQEFHTIENIVVQIKEDTEQIAGLILFGLRGKSTLEFLEIETSDTLKENASRLMAIFASRDRIASTIYALKKKRSQMTTSGAGPEKTDSDQALRHALAMVCPDDTVRTYAPKTLDIKNLVHLSEKTDDETIAGLREIKGILGDCVKAINEYADSAQKYISIFKEDLQAISDTICSKGDEATLDNKFMLAAESSIKKHGALHTDIINITYIRIISRLSDPHINSIINKDRKMPETGENFTLF